MNIKGYLALLHRQGNLNININKEDKEIEVSLRVIKRCNENCIFCSTDLDGKIISFKLLIEILQLFLNSCSNKYKLTFTFTGGEPTLYKDLEKVIFFLQKKGVSKLRIETNAVVFANEKFIKKYEKFKGFLNFFVSFHSHKRDIYNKITNSELYDTAIKGIYNLLSLFGNDKVEFNFVMNKYNYKDLEDYIYFVNKNFFFSSKINLVISVMLPNKLSHKNYIVTYTELVDVLNKIDFSKFNNIIINDLFDVAGGYCQFPFCIFKKLNYSNKSLKDCILYIDSKVGSNIMYKGEKCTECKFNKYCLGISKFYYKLFGDEEITPIYKL